MNSRNQIGIRFHFVIGLKIRILFYFPKKLDQDGIEFTFLIN